MPVQSAIASPTNNSPIPLTTFLPVRGWAWSGDGYRIASVEVSRDGGITWTPAVLDDGRAWTQANVEDPDVKRDVLRSIEKGWSWTKWEARIPLGTGDAG